MGKEVGASLSLSLSLDVADDETKMLYFRSFL